MTPPWPNFLLVGAAKAGTTALAAHLGRHPEVFVAPQKEASYFLFEDSPPAFTGPGDDYLATMVRSSEADYRALFRGSTGARARGEASVYYLHRPDALDRIADRIPGIRVIAVLRNPADRAVSAWAHLVRDGREVEELTPALGLEAERLAAGWEWCWGYTALSHYVAGVERLLGRFGERAAVVRYDDLAADPVRVTRRLLTFLDVDPDTPLGPVERRNESGRPRSPALSRALLGQGPVQRTARAIVPEPIRRRVATTTQRWNTRSLPVPVAERDRLAERFTDDVDALERLLGWDLRGWRPGSGVGPSSPAQPTWRIPDRSG